MKRHTTISILASAILLSLFLNGCKRDTTTLRGTISHYGNDKVYMDGNTPRWHDGDMLKINENDIIISSSNGITATMQVPTSGEYKAVYPSSIAQPLVNGNVANLTFPRLQIYQEDDNDRQIVRTPMCATSSNSTLNFKNMGALLAIELRNNTTHSSITIDSVTVKSLSYNSSSSSPAAAIALWGDAIANDISSATPTYAFTDPATAGINDSITLACGIQQGLDITLSNSSTSQESKTVYLYVPAVSNEVNNLFSIRVFATIANGNRYTYLLSQTNSYSGNIPRNEKASVPFNMTDAIEHEIAPPEIPEGALTGLFTVNSNGGRVYFSKGNLQYNQTGTHIVSGGRSVSGTWRFAEQQWTYGTSLYSDGWFQLFGWGTSGHIYSPTTKLYTANVTGYAGTLANTNEDWGQYNAISNGGATQPGLWRTPTGEEWDFLLGTTANGRTVNGGTGEGHCYQLLQVNQIWGLLIYPDGYTKQSYYNSASSITYVPSGCVFLPMAGYRRENNLNSLGSYGYYWSSSPESSTTITNSAKVLKFYHNTQETPTLNVLPVYSINKSYGCSVRLVQDVPSGK